MGLFWNAFPLVLYLQIVYYSCPYFEIFNPFGQGTWYLINQDPEDPDYLWAIVDLMEVEVGSVSKRELEETKVRFNLSLERDLYFEPMNAQKLYKGLRNGKHY